MNIQHPNTADKQLREESAAMAECQHPEMFWLNRFICSKSVIGLFINKTFKFVCTIQPKITCGPTIKHGLSVWLSYAHLGNCLYV